MSSPGGSVRPARADESQDPSPTRSQPHDDLEDQGFDGVLDASSRDIAVSSDANSDNNGNQALLWLTDVEAAPILFIWVVFITIFLVLITVSGDGISGGTWPPRGSGLAILAGGKVIAVMFHGFAGVAHHAFLWYMIRRIVHQWKAEREHVSRTVALFLASEALLLLAYIGMLHLLTLFTRWVTVAELDWSTYNNHLGAWSTGFKPDTFRSCEARVSTQQAQLFGEIYWTQFPRMATSRNNSLGDWINYSDEPFLAIHTNSTLCSQGFEGNGDLYGLGIRLGIYLQWLAALISNQLLPDNRKGMQKAYLIFNISICAATFVSIFTVCTFSIEIQILYWLYWGGVVCVFSSSPSQTRLGRQAKWVELDWSTGIQYFTHLLMAYHFFWYLYWAYDQIFSRMPCGTQHFFLVRIMDPSILSCYVRDTLAMLSFPPALAFVMAFPFVIVCFVSETWVSVKGSYIAQSLLVAIPVSQSPDVAEGSDRFGQSVPTFNTRVLHRIEWMYRIPQRLHKRLRVAFDFPEQPMQGIRLITPVDITDRRNYRIRCAILGITSFILCVWTVEATLRWNKIVGVYSISSTGQYLALTIGLGTFVSVIWQLVQQEMQRRHSIRRRQAIGDDLEMIDLPATLVGALQHAAAQPDTEFYMSGGLGLGSASSSVYFDALSARTSLNLGRDENGEEGHSDDASRDVHSSAV